MQPSIDVAPPELSALQRMEAGQPYQASDAELMMLRQRVHARLAEYASVNEGEHLKRMRILATVFGALGDDPDVEAPLHVEYGRHVYAGRGLVVGPFCVFVDAGRITLGDHVRLGPAVHLYAVARPLKPAHRAAKYEQAADITVGDGVWIGGHSVINPGVTIGAGTTIAPGSVVMEDIPANVYAGGNPCTVIRNLEA